MDTKTPLLYNLWGAKLLSRVTRCCQSGRKRALLSITGKLKLLLSGGKLKVDLCVHCLQNLVKRFRPWGRSNKKPKKRAGEGIQRAKEYCHCRTYLVLEGGSYKIKSLICVDVLDGCSMFERPETQQRAENTYRLDFAGCIASTSFPAMFFDIHYLSPTRFDTSNLVSIAAEGPSLRATQRHPVTHWA